MTACNWDDLTTGQIVAMRAVGHLAGEGYYSPVRICGESCAGRLECGGRCDMVAGHLYDCECCGDEPGCPGSCPA